MRHKADINRLRCICDIVLLHQLRRRDWLRINLYRWVLLIVRLVKILVQHGKRFADILLARRIDQHIRGRVIAIVNPNDILIGQIEDVRDCSACIKCRRSIPVQVFVQLAGHKVQRVLRSVQIAQAQLTVHNAIILRFAVHPFGADALLLENIGLGAQAWKQHASGVDICKVVEILLIGSGEHISRIVLTRIGVDFLCNRAVLQNMHQVV